MTLDDAQQVEKLLGDLNQAHELFFASDAENTRLREQVNKYRDRLKNATHILGEYGESSQDEIDGISEVDVVRVQYNNALGQIEELESKLKKCEECTAGQPADVEVSEAYQALRQQLAHRDVRIAALEGQIKRLQSNGHNNARPEDEKLSEVAKLRNNLEDCNKKVKQLQSGNTSSNQRSVDSTNDRLAQLEQDLQASNDKNERLRSENDHIHEIFEHIRTAGAELAATHQKTLADIAELRAGSNKSQADNLSPPQAKLEQGVLQNLVDYQRANITELERIIHQGFTSRDQTTSTHPDHITRVKEQKERNEAAKREADMAAGILLLEQELSRSQEAEGVLQDKIAQLEIKLPDLNELRRQHRESMEAQKHNCRRLEDQMRLKSHQLKECQETVDTLRTILQVESHDSSPQLSTTWLRVVIET